jgi:hypothetical protein
MGNRIATGTILIADGALLPQSLHVESEPFVYGWRLIKNLGIEDLTQIISKAGWNLFYIAGAVEMNAFGSDEQKTATKAIKQILASSKLKNFNCLEITQVKVKKSMGLPSVKITAHSRHIQKENSLS